MSALQNYELQRIPTRIYGLDQLLYGGLDIVKKPFTIVIRGGIGTDSTLFALQLMYGIAQSLHETERKLPQDFMSTPVYISSCHKKKDIEIMMTNTFISSCLYLLTRKVIEGSYNESDLGIITRHFFDTGNIVCMTNGSQNVPKLPVDEIRTMPDRLIAENALYYNDRTGTLHFRTPNNIADISNIIFPRLYSSLNEYADLEHDFSEKLNELLQIQLLKTHIHPLEKFESVFKTTLLVLELDNTKGHSINDMKRIIKQMKEKSVISILVVDDDTQIPANDADIMIDLYNRIANGYVFHYLNIVQNSHQDSVLGEHQYKRRDFGIEVFPSFHTYFKKKKNFHRSQLYTHSSVIDDTFPQYLDRKVKQNQDDATYADYVNTKDEYLRKNMESLHPLDDVQLISYDILKKIFISENEDGEDVDKDKGTVTAIIGSGNTYKRYFTIGCAFSAAVKDEDTLIIVLSKEKHLIQKRMSCPARMTKNCHKPRCIECYRHFHFMSIYPEYITQDEFIYMLNQHIKLAYDIKNKRYVRRIIIDDLQILDYGFPFLNGNGDFLSSVMTVCRENNIALYILCDKKAKSRDILKALADNVVCTEKTDNGLPKIYVERCAGYYNPPSKMYCGIIKDIKHLFECNVQFSNEGKEVYELSINPLYVDDKAVPNIDDFWC